MDKKNNIDRRDYMFLIRRPKTKTSENVPNAVWESVPVIYRMTNKPMLTPWTLWLWFTNVIIKTSVIIMHVFKTIKIKIPINQTT